jgi:uncharacterized protein YdhG (YjbR/CyaY superfamily)
MNQPVSVDEYIKHANPATRDKLKEFRRIITKAAPGAEEKISYGMPAYHLDGPLVYFGGFKNHVSLFATASRVVKEKFAEELAPFIQSKGTIQFPLTEPLPSELIRKIVLERVRENTSKS